MAADQPVTASMTWRTIELPNRCANQLCTNQPGEGAFVLLIEERHLGAEVGTPIATGPPVTLMICAPCAAVMRGEQR